MSQTATDTKDGSTFRRNVAACGARGFWVAGTKNLVIENRAIANGADFTVPLGNPLGPTLNASWAIQGSKPQANFRTPFP